MSGHRLLPVVEELQDQLVGAHVEIARLAGALSKAQAEAAKWRRRVAA